MKLNLKNPIVFLIWRLRVPISTQTELSKFVTSRYIPTGMRSPNHAYQPRNAHSCRSICRSWHLRCRYSRLPTFKEVARNIANDIEGCDLAGFNSNRFDIPVLAEEFLRAGVDIDMSRRKFIGRAGHFPQDGATHAVCCL